MSLHNGALLLADAETVRLHETGGNYGDLGRLLAQAKIRPRQVDLDVLEPHKAARYWARSERHDTVLDFRYGGAGLDAFCRLLEQWLRHFYRIDAKVEAVRAIEDATGPGISASMPRPAPSSTTSTGPSARSSRQRRILSLFRWISLDGTPLRQDVAGRRVYMAAAMDEGWFLRVKPQNLLVNLPLAAH